MDHTPSPTPGAPDPGASMPPPDHPDVERKESPSKQKPHDEPEIAYEEDISSDGENPDCRPEIRPVPGLPELSPTPDHLRT